MCHSIVKTLGKTKISKAQSLAFRYFPWTDVGNKDTKPKSQFSSSSPRWMPPYSLNPLQAGVRAYLSWLPHLCSYSPDHRTIHTWDWEPLKAKDWILLPHCAQCLTSVGHREKIRSEYCCMRCSPDHPPALAPLDHHSVVCMDDQSPPLSSRISAKLWSQNGGFKCFFLYVPCDPGLVT